MKLEEGNLPSSRDTSLNASGAEAIWKDWKKWPISFQDNTNRNYISIEKSCSNFQGDGGVLGAGFYDQRKTIMLGHSSRTDVTKKWPIISKGASYLGREQKGD